MNYQVASSIHTLFEQLRQEVQSRLPQEIDEGQKYWDGKPITYRLSTIDFESMSATYTRYVGCGEYEERVQYFTIDELFD